MLPKQAYYHGFSLLDGVGFRALQRLLRVSGAIESAWLDFESLSKYCFSQNRAFALIDRWRNIDVVKEWANLDALGISLICLEQDSYPALLKAIHLPPIALYVRGHLALPKQALTVVGTRKMSNYGRACVQALIPPLASGGFGIVSGLAFGVDATCHEAALEAGLYTVAVLASGVNMVTPSSHEYLARRIIEAGGAIVSEMPPGRMPYKGSFPRRNRILAGLTQQTLVIEADLESGSLNTAHQALTENREVLAVPGPIYSPVSKGCHKLLREGATQITCVDDILHSYNVAAHSPRTSPFLDPEERDFARHLGQQTLTLDEIMAKTKRTASASLALLTALELKGLTTKLPGQGYVLSVTLDD